MSHLEVARCSAEAGSRQRVTRLLVGWLVDFPAMLACLRDASALAVVRAATLT